MNTEIENNKKFDLDLALNILKEKRLIDNIALMELSKQPGIESLDDLFTALQPCNSYLSEKLWIDVKDIYDIICKENTVAGCYREVNVRTPNKIRSMIAKWNPPTASQMKIGDVIEDIFRRVSENIQGECYYYTGRSKCESSKGKYAYKLIVRKNNAIFVNLNNQISYQIVIKKK